MNYISETIDDVMRGILEEGATEVEIEGMEVEEEGEAAAIKTGWSIIYSACLHSACVCVGGCRKALH